MTDTNTDNNNNTTTHTSMATAPQATVDAARLALAARAEYAKRCNSECLEKGTFYIVIDEKSKNDLVGRRGSPGQLEDIGNQLLEEVQRMNEENASNGFSSDVSNLEFTKLMSSSKNVLHRKTRSRTPRTHSLHSKRNKPFRNSQTSIASKCSYTSYQSGRITPCSQISASNVDSQLPSPQSNLLLPGIPLFRLQLPTTQTNPLSSDDKNTPDDELKSAALTTNSTTINTPEDFISSPSPADFFEIKRNEINELNDNFETCFKKNLRKESFSSRLESKNKKHKKISKNNSSASVCDRKKEMLIKLNQQTKPQPDSIRRLSSTVSSVFERNDSSNVYVPFPPDNPITTTSANSKPVSPVSLAIAGVVMLSGTCAFIVSFALGKHGNWTLAASVIMGMGAIAVFSGLCWYLAHTSAPPAPVKDRNSNGSGVEIKVVDRKQMDNLIKKGVCVESVNNTSSLA